MKPDVERALAELRAGLPGHTLSEMEDGDGGAFVFVDGVEIGDRFDPQLTWIGFHITYPYPDSDVYPHFIDAHVRYVGSGETPNEHADGCLPKAMTRGAEMPGFKRSAIQISRKSNRRNAATDTALQKLLRIVEFLKSR